MKEHFLNLILFLKEFSLLTEEFYSKDKSEDLSAR